MFKSFIIHNFDDTKLEFTDNEIEKLTYVIYFVQEKGKSSQVRKGLFLQKLQKALNVKIQKRHNSTCTEHQRLKYNKVHFTELPIY